MGKQYNKVEKRKRRVAYFKRKKSAGRAKEAETRPKQSQPEATEVKDATTT